MVLTAACWGGPVQAERFPTDPVEELRRTLRTPPADLAARDPELASRLRQATKPEDRLRILAEARDRALGQRVRALRTLSELHRALALPDWGEGQDMGGPLPGRFISSQEELSAATERNLALLLQRFRAAVGHALSQGSATERLAVLKMLQEMAQSPRTSEARTGVGRSFGPELADLVRREGPPSVREAAARTLGLISADSKVAVPALRSLLTSGSAPERRAAAEGLAAMMRNLAQPPTTGTRTGGRVEVDRGELVNAGRLIVPAAALGLRDSDPGVRRPSAEALEQAAAALLNQLPSPRESEEALDLEVDRREAADMVRRGLPPLIRALRDETPALSRAVTDPDLEVRLLARRTLEDMGNARQRLLRLAPAPEAAPPRQALPQPPEPSPNGAGPTNGGGAEQPAPPPRPAPPEGMLLQGLETALPSLIRGLADPSPQARLGALDALEVLGPSAAPAVPALLRTLCDRDKFVRWAAARTLGKIGPVRGQGEVVPALARMLRDPDLSLDEAAATALEQYGPAAQEALPALIRAVGASDGVMRVAAIRAIEAIGTGAAPAIPTLTAAVNDLDPRVRQAAAEALDRFGPRARSAEAVLRLHLNDTSPEVRRAASDALLDITQE